MVFYKNFFRDKFFNPFTFASVFFLFSFGIAPYYFFEFDTQIYENHLINSKDINSLIFPIIIATLGFLLFTIGSSLFRFILPISSDRTIAELLKRNVNRYSILPGSALFFCILAIEFALILIKYYLISTNQIGSLSGFLTEPTSSSSFNYFRSLFSFSPIFLSFFALVYYAYGRGKFYLIIFVTAELLLSFWMGDRRDIILYLLSIVYVRLSFKKSLFESKSSMVLVMLVVLIFVYTSSIVADYLGNVNKSNGVDYFEVIIYAYNDFLENPNFNKNILLDGVFGWVNQLYIIETAVRIKDFFDYSQYNPLYDFLLQSLPIIGQQLKIFSSSDIEYILFKNTLVSSGEFPYLTTPLFAESFLVGGYSALLVYSLFSGIIFHIYYWLSSRSIILFLWFSAFVFELSAGMMQSLVTVGPLRATKVLLFLLLFLFLKNLYHVIRSFKFRV
jgi:hypothetical protein